MSRPFILLGDKTTHDGKVVSASSTLFIDGQPVALVGDRVNCPKRGHGVNPIVEGSADWSENGIPLVVDGCRSECGCAVIASTVECWVG